MSKKISNDERIRREHLTASLDFGDAAVRCAVVDEELREVELTWACETPFARWFGDLQLEVTAEACSLARLNNGAPLIDNHWGEQIGVILKAWIGDDRMGYARARFSRSVKATEIYNDVKDGIRTHISPGFWLQSMVLVEEKEGEEPLYRATKWEPFEVSIVSVAAMDELRVAAEADSDGWGSDHIKALVATAAGFNDNQKETEMKVKDQTAEPAAVETAAAQAPAAPAPVASVGADHDGKKEKAELKRQGLIRAAAAKMGVSIEKMNEAIEANLDADQFVLDCLDDRNTRGHTAAAEDIGMTEKDVKDFRLMRLINAHAAMPGTVERQRAMDAAGYELELCNAAAEKRQKINGNISLPNEVIRAASITEPSDGGFLVDQRRASMIDILTASTKMLQLGARPLGNMVGDVELPRMDAGLTGYLLDEDDEPTTSSVSWGLLKLRAKTVGATAYLTRSMQKQTSYDAEMLYREEIARAIGLKMDQLCISGIGGRVQPIGILNQVGIGAIAGGTDGANPTWDHVVKLETEVDQDNALVGRAGYLTNGKMRGTLKRTPQHATANVGGWVWQPYPGNLDPTVGMINGYPAHVSNQVPSDLTKGSSTGVCSAIIFGNFNDAVIVTWGGIDLNVDPYSSSKKGGLNVTAFYDFDFALLRASSFAAMQDATVKA